MKEINDATLQSIAKTRAIVEFLFTQYLEDNTDRKDDYIKESQRNNIDRIAKKYFEEMKNSL